MVSLNSAICAWVLRHSCIHIVLAGHVGHSNPIYDVATRELVEIPSKTPAGSVDHQTDHGAAQCENRGFSLGDEPAMDETTC